MKSLQYDCYCGSLNNQESFQCIICKKMHHSKCYTIYFMEKVPPNMKCLDCRLNQYEPFLQIKQNLLIPKKFYILNQNEKYNKRELKVDMKSRYTEYFQNIHWEVVIACSKLKPTPKKAVGEQAQTHQKKNQNIPQYEWPTENIYLEWNSHHIKYDKFSLAIIPRELVKTQNFITFTVDDLQYSAFLTVLLVSRKNQPDIIHRIMENQKQNEIALLSQLRQQYQSQIEKSILNDEQVHLESPFLTVPLIDPMTLEQIDIPIRSTQCTHFECTDLKRFIERNQSPIENRWKCPRCLLNIDIDSIVVDFIQMKIINDIRMKHPLRSSSIQKVYIIDNELNYQYDMPERSKFESPITFSLQLQKIRDNFPSMIDLLQLLFDPDLQEYPLDRFGVHKVFEVLDQTTDCFEIIKNEEQSIIFMATFFNCEPLLQIQLQPNLDYSQQFSFIYLCELFYCNSFLGVLADFCCLLESQIKNICSHLIAFTLFYPQNNQFQAYLEMAMATSFAIKQNVQFEKYSAKSIGYIVGYMLCIYFEKLEIKCVEEKIKTCKFMSSLLSEFTLPSYESTESLYSISEFMIQLFKQYLQQYQMRLKKKEDIANLIDTLYQNKIQKFSKTQVLSFSILIYYILQNIKKESQQYLYQNLENKNDGKDPKASVYFISSATYIQMEKQFNELIEIINGKGNDIINILKQNQLDFKSYRTAFGQLEYTQTRLSNFVN